MANRKTGWFSTVFAYGMVAVLSVLGAIVRILPARLWGPIGWLLSRVLWWTLGRYRRRTIANLELIRGLTGAEAIRFGKASFLSNTLVLLESLAMPRIIARRGVVVDVTITPEADAVLSRVQRGEDLLLIAIGAHAGVWELGGAELAKRVLPVPSLVSSRLPKNPLYERFLRNLRVAFGLTLVEKDSYLRTVLRRVKEKQPTFCQFLCDQHARGGIVLPFMGEPACTVGAPATLIHRFNAPALFAGCIRVRPGRYALEVEALDYSEWQSLDTEEATKRITADLNQRITRGIERAPEQWTWGHRRWRHCCGVSESG